ncbi:excinuclease ABC subunit A, partial [Vibrio parahaemolyticus SBR10290]
THRLISRLKV